MSLIIFVILAIIVFGRIGLDKAANREFDKEQDNKKMQQRQFEESVVDMELEREVEREMWSEESELHLKQLFNSVPVLKEMYEKNISREDWLFGSNIRKIILMSEMGKLPLFGGVYLEIWPQNNHVGIDYYLDAEKELGRIIQTNLRNHGVEAQMIFDDGKKQVYNSTTKEYETGFAMPKFEWEPYYNGGDYGERL